VGFPGVLLYTLQYQFYEPNPVSVGKTPTALMSRWGSSSRFGPRHVQTSDEVAPGSYNLRGGPGGKSCSYTMRPKTAPKPSVMSNNPGPGRYDVVYPTSIGQGVGKTLGLAHKDTFHQRDVAGMPGPGAYDVPTMASRSKSPSFSFRAKSVLSAAFQNRAEQSPGPASYAIGSTIGRNCPSATIAGRNFPRLAQSCAPGVGRYNVGKSLNRVLNKSSSFSIRAKVKNSYEPSTQSVPGVGSYDIDAHYKPARAATIGHHAPDTSNTNDSPGPAMYVVAPIRSRTALRYARHRRKRNKLESTPSPADYMVEGSSTKKRAPAFSFTNAHVFKPLDTPGPRYDVAAYKKKAPIAITMASRAQPGQQKDSFPSPAAYNLSEYRRATSPAYTIRSKPTQSKQNVASPGPIYYPSWEKKDRQPSHSFQGRAYGSLMSS
jgi:hypothetical protein